MPLEFDGVNGIIKNTTSDGDVTIKGNDGGSEISLLTFDVSAEGVATFNSKVGIKDSAPDVLLHVTQGGEPPAEGMFRYNTTTDEFEGYADSSWGSIGGGASAGGAIYENVDDITTSYSITAGSNGMSVGPMTLATGVTVTVPSGQRWVIL